MTEQVPDDEINPEERKISSNRAKRKREQDWQSKMNVVNSRCQITKAIKKYGILARIELNGKGSRFGKLKRK